MNYGGQGGWPGAPESASTGELIFVSHSSLAGQRRALPPAGKLIIGREPGCDITFDPTKDRVVGRKHAQLEIRPEGVYLTDLASRNGTFYRGTPVKDIPIPLMDGDQFRLGEDGPVLQIKLATQAAPEHTQVLRPKSRSPEAGAPVAQSYGPPTGMVDVSGWANQKTSAEPQAGWGAPPAASANAWNAPAAPPQPQNPAWNQGGGGWSAPPPAVPAPPPAWNQGSSGWGAAGPAGPVQAQGREPVGGKDVWGGAPPAQQQGPGPAPWGQNASGWGQPQPPQPPQAQGWGQTGGAGWNAPPAAPPPSAPPAAGPDAWGGGGNAGWGQPAAPTPRPPAQREPGPIFGGASAGGWSSGPPPVQRMPEPEREDTSAFMASLGNPLGGGASKGSAPPPNLAGGATSLFGNDGWGAPPHAAGSAPPAGPPRPAQPYGMPAQGWNAPVAEPAHPSAQGWNAPVAEPAPPPAQGWNATVPSPVDAGGQGWNPAPASPQPSSAKSAARKVRPPPPPEEEEEEVSAEKKAEPQNAQKPSGGFQWTNERIAYARQAGVVLLVFALACAGGFAFAWLNPSPLFPVTPLPEAPAE